MNFYAIAALVAAAAMLSFMSSDKSDQPGPNGLQASVTARHGAAPLAK